MNIPIKSNINSVIIGAGFAGIASALRLRALGHNVTLIERLDQIGGRARTFVKDGYKHDAGPTVITAPFLFRELFELFNENSKLLPIPSAFEFKSLKMRAEPGEEASFLIGTSLENLLLLYEVHVDGKRISQKWITLSNEQRKMTLPIKESYRGGVQLSFIGVHNNREITETRTISVPYTNKKLQLTLGTYCNKVQPGSKEKWTMTISCIKGEKLAAELLAGMYDQSLDQFKTQNWAMNL